MCESKTLWNFASETFLKIPVLILIPNIYAYERASEYTTLLSESTKNSFSSYYYFFSYFLSYFFFCSYFKAKVNVLLFDSWKAIKSFKCKLVMVSPLTIIKFSWISLSFKNLLRTLYVCSLSGV